VKRPLTVLIAAAVLALVACSHESASSPTPTPTPQQDVAAQVSVSLGGEIGLPDGGATLKIPPGALAADTAVSIKRVAPDATNGGDFELGVSAGERYEVDLGGQTLNQQALLEIPFDPSLLPQGADATQVFLAYYDGMAKQWVYAGGMVDTDRNVVILPVTHASWWNPFTWNWGAWVAVLDKMLKGNVTDFLQAVSLLTEECPQQGQSVSVDASGANNVVQGCVQKDDPQTPELRVVNPKSFYFEVNPVSGGNGYPPQTMIAPGDSLRFQANTSDPSPLVVSAEITQKAGGYLVVDLIIQMLPGFNQLGFQSSTLACITEKLHDVSYVTSATYALLVAHDGAAAAEQLIDMLRDSDAMRRFITGAKDCYYGPASTWSIEGAKQIGAATSTIISAVDFVANFLLNPKSQIAFKWVPSQDALEAAYSAEAGKRGLADTGWHFTGDATGDGRDEVFIFVSGAGCASCHTGKWLVFSGAKLIFEMAGTSPGEIRPLGDKFQLITALWSEPGSMGNPSNYRRETYAWNGQSYVVTETMECPAKQIEQYGEWTIGKGGPSC